MQLYQAMRSHMKNIKIINFKNLRYILCEKPLCKNLEESELIEKILKKNIRLFVIIIEDVTFN